MIEYIGSLGTATGRFESKLDFGPPSNKGSVLVEEILDNHKPSEAKTVSEIQE